MQFCTFHAISINKSALGDMTNSLKFLLLGIALNAQNCAELKFSNTNPMRKELVAISQKKYLFDGRYIKFSNLHTRIYFSKCLYSKGWGGGQFTKSVWLGIE